jgi:hypothetical protein
MIANLPPSANTVAASIFVFLFFILWCDGFIKILHGVLLSTRRASLLAAIFGCVAFGAWSIFGFALAGNMLSPYLPIAQTVSLSPPHQLLLKGLTLVVQAAFFAFAFYVQVASLARFMRLYRVRQRFDALSDQYAAQPHP